MVTLLSELPFVNDANLSSFEREKDAYEYAGTCGFACDGVLALSTRRDETLKIKDTRSMELMYDGNLGMSSFEGNTIISLKGRLPYLKGDILEVRFRCTDGTATIVDIFRRDDKENANSMEACTNIYRSSLAAHMSDDVIDQRHGQGSTGSRGRRRTPLVGVRTPRGQRKDTRRGTRPIEVLEVESAHERKGVVLQQQQGTRRIQCRIHESKESRGPLCYGISRLAIFSLSHVYKDISELSRQGIPVLSCGYVYDSADSSGMLLNVAGIRMQRTTSTDATVQWGRDPEYTEHALVTSDIHDRLRTVRAHDVESTESVGDDTALHTSEHAPSKTMSAADSYVNSLRLHIEGVLKRGTRVARFSTTSSLPRKDDRFVDVRLSVMRDMSVSLAEKQTAFDRRYYSPRGRGEGRKGTASNYDNAVCMLATRDYDFCSRNFDVSDEYVGALWHAVLACATADRKTIVSAFAKASDKRTKEGLFTYLGRVSLVSEPILQSDSTRMAAEEFDRSHDTLRDAYLMDVSPMLCSSVLVSRVRRMTDLMPLLGDVQYSASQGKQREIYIPSLSFEAPGV
ncbi:hypothetical protein JB92DRAFT_3110796 [Gautieria morchelliformis]|nr:hypothetical protein JB92DRAFT_3110796 [Gautieria morchelliformis]